MTYREWRAFHISKAWDRGGRSCHADEQCSSLGHACPTYRNLSVQSHPNAEQIPSSVTLRYDHWIRVSDVPKPFLHIPSTTQHIPLRERILIALCSVNMQSVCIKYCMKSRIIIRSSDNVSLYCKHEQFSLFIGLNFIFNILCNCWLIQDIVVN